MNRNYNYGQYEEEDLSENELLDLDDIVEQSQQKPQPRNQNNKQKQNDDFQIEVDNEDDLLKSDDDLKNTKKQNTYKKEEEDEYGYEYEEDVEDFEAEEEEIIPVKQQKIPPKTQQLQIPQMLPPQPPKIIKTEQSDKNKQVQKQPVLTRQPSQSSQQEQEEEESVKPQKNVRSLTKDQQKQQIPKTNPTSNKATARSKSQKPPYPKSTKNTVEFVPVYTNMMEKVLENKEYNKLSFQEVGQENNKLRQQLKELNQEISKKLENSKLNILKKDTQKVKRPPSHQFKTASAEEQNNQQILDRTNKELYKLQEKIDKYCDPGYLIDMNDQMEDIKKQIDQTKRNNKNQNLTNQKHGKDLDQIDQQPQESLKEMQEIKTQVSILERKNQKYQARLDQIEEENSIIKDKLPEQNSKHEKLILLAHNYKVDVNITPAEMKRRQKYEELSKKEENLIKLLEKLKHGNEVKEAMFRKEVDELKVLIYQKNEEINQKEQEIFQMNNRVGDIMGRENISSRQLRDEYVKMGIPYNLKLKQYDEFSVNSAPDRNFHDSEYKDKMQHTTPPKENLTNKPLKPGLYPKNQQKAQSQQHSQSQAPLQSQKQELPKIHKVQVEEHEIVEIKDEIQELQSAQIEEELKIEEEKKRQHEIELEKQREREAQVQSQAPKGFAKPFGVKKFQKILPIPQQEAQKEEETQPKLIIPVKEQQIYKPQEQQQPVLQINNPQVKPAIQNPQVQPVIQNSPVQPVIQQEPKKEEGYTFGGGPTRLGKNRGLQVKEEHIVQKPKEEIYDPFSKFDDNITKKPIIAQQPIKEEPKPKPQEEYNPFAMLDNTNTYKKINPPQQQVIQPEKPKEIPPPEQPKEFNFNRRRGPQQETNPIQVPTEVIQPVQTQPAQYQSPQQNLNLPSKAPQEDDLFKGPSGRNNNYKKPNKQMNQKRDIFGSDNNEFNNIPEIQEIKPAFKQPVQQPAYQNPPPPKDEEDDGLDFLKQEKPKINYNDDDDLYGGIGKKKQQQDQPAVMTLADKKRQKQKEQEAQQKILAKKAENNDDMFGDLDI